MFIILEFGGVFVICLHTKFHSPSPSGPLVTARKPKTKSRLYIVAMLLSYIVQKKLP